MKIRFTIGIIMLSCGIPLLAQTNYFPSSGNVGIGTTSPINTLDVNGTGRFRRQASTTAGLTIGGDALSLNGWGANNPYIEWRNSTGVRQGYMGWNTSRLSLVLENGYNYTVENGNMGVGTSLPNDRLDVMGRLRISENGSDYGLVYHIADPADTKYNNVWPDQHERALIFKSNAYLDGWGAGGGGFQFWTFDQDPGGTWGSYSGSLKQAMVIRRNGNIGIGVASPDSKLTVKGDIHTREVKVDLAGAVGPDYVFEKDYPLTSLEELKSYIDQNKHLPEIPSAKEMEENGINLKEMNILLLKKVEELTLHLIQKEEDINSLKASTDSSAKKVEELTMHVIELQKEIISIKKHEK